MAVWSQKYCKRTYSQMVSQIRGNSRIRTLIQFFKSSGIRSGIRQSHNFVQIFFPKRSFALKWHLKLIFELREISRVHLLVFLPIHNTVNSTLTVLPNINFYYLPKPTEKKAQIRNTGLWNIICTIYFSRYPDFYCRAAWYSLEESKRVLLAWHVGKIKIAPSYRYAVYF
jgi:hypothetical protein